MNKEFKIGMGCLGLFILFIGFIMYNFLKIEDYCHEEFFDFLHRENVRIEILKCSEGKPLYPKTIKVAKILGDSLQIATFLANNNFQKHDNLDYRGRYGYEIYQPYIKEINQNDIYSYTNTDKKNIFYFRIISYS